MNLLSALVYALRTPVPKVARTPRPPKERKVPAPVVDRPAIRLRPDLRKDNAACCLSRRDDLGRLPIGWCSESCLRRPRVIEQGEVAS